MHPQATSRGLLCRRPLGVLSLAVALALGVGSTGCSNGHDAIKKDMDALRAELTRMRTTNMVLQDRVEALEEHAPAAEAASAKAGSPSDRPVLEVVTLTPQDEPGEPVAALQEIPTVAETGPRPVIVGDGDGVEQLAEGEEQKAKPGVPGSRYPKRGGR